MRHVFILNPAAGKRRSRQTLLARIEGAFPAGDYTLLTTAGAGDAKSLAQRALTRR